MGLVVVRSSRESVRTASDQRANAPSIATSRLHMRQFVMVLDKTAFSMHPTPVLIDVRVAILNAMLTAPYRDMGLR